MTIKGIGITEKKGVGTVHWYKPDEPVLHDPEGTVEEELERFKRAKKQAEQQLKQQQKQTSEEAGKKEAAIFSAHIQFLNDPHIEKKVKKHIKDGLSAEQAAHTTFEAPIKQYEERGGKTAERADDLRDVRDRLIRLLTDNTSDSLSAIPEGSIILAEHLTPSDTAQMDPTNVHGLATEKGGKTSHAAIIARSLGIPAVIGVGKELQNIKNGEKILIDGKNGTINRNPSEKQRKDARKENTVDTVTEHVSVDGERIDVAANIANPEDLERAQSLGADGIGLYRTEFMFLERNSPPTEDEHYNNYVKALNQFPEDRVIIRTLDIGGDKPVPYIDIEPSDNPFLGVRGMRLSLNEGKDLFKTQIRALLRAGATENGDNLAIMFPLITTVEELEQTLALVTDIADELEAENKEHTIPELGIMIETSSAVMTADALADQVDFLSIGTNDLTQYIMAASRTDSRVSSLQDPLYPAVLRSISQVIEHGHEHDAWVGMCGEMAGIPRLTELLVGLGLDELSMAPPAVPRVKQNIQSLDKASAKQQADNILRATKRSDVESLLDQ